MRTGEPSRTAFGAATHRAVHQDLEAGRIFRDPLAWQILGADREQVLATTPEGARRLRLFIAVRHRFAEDSLSLAFDRGTRQLVVLGAGLDTFGYRNPHPALRVFEVDHPDTGAWKQGRLVEAGIGPVGNGAAADVDPAVTYVGVDFEWDDLMECLVAHGFDPDRAAFFMWLGVVPYLSHDAVTSTLRTIARVPDTEVVFDYPTGGGRDDEAGAGHHSLRERVASVGEPILSAFEPGELARLLADLGYDEVEDLGRVEILPRFFGVDADADASHPGGGHVVRARSPLR